VNSGSGNRPLVPAIPSGTIGDEFLPPAEVTGNTFSSSPCVAYIFLEGGQPSHLWYSLVSSARYRFPGLGSGQAKVLAAIAFS